MMKYQSITILFVLLFLFRIAQSQCIETGYVKEYNGVEEKTPLPGVELQVVGSPSAVSDEQGRFELHFAVLKPGQAVKYNEIINRDTSFLIKKRWRYGGFPIIRLPLWW